MGQRLEKRGQGVHPGWNLAERKMREGVHARFDLLELTGPRHCGAALRQGPQRAALAPGNLHLADQNTAFEELQIERADVPSQALSHSSDDLLRRILRASRRVEEHLHHRMFLYLGADFVG